MTIGISEPLRRSTPTTRDAERPSSYCNYRVIRPWLTSTFDELIVYCRTTLLLSKKITSDFLSPSAPLLIRFTYGIKFVGFECSLENSYSHISLPVSVKEVFTGSP